MLNRNFSSKIVVTYLQIACDFIVNMFLEDEIISFVKDNPFIYDRKHEEFRNTKLKEKVWKQLSARLNMEEMTLRTKWRSFRDQFRRELRRLKRKKEMGIMPTYKFKHFKSLMFLKDSVAADSSNLIDEIESAKNEEQNCSKSAFMVSDVEVFSEHSEEESKVDVFNEYSEEESKVDVFNEYSEEESKVDVFNDHLEEETKVGVLNEHSKEKSKVYIDELIPDRPSFSSNKKTTRKRTPSDSSDRLQSSQGRRRDSENGLKTRPGNSNETSTDYFFKSLATTIENLKLTPLDLLDLQSRILVFVNEEVKRLYAYNVDIDETNDYNEENPLQELYNKHDSLLAKKCQILQSENNEEEMSCEDLTINDVRIVEPSNNEWFPGRETQEDPLECDYVRKRTRKAESETRKREYNQKLRMMGKNYIGFQKRGEKYTPKGESKLGPACTSDYCKRSKVFACDAFTKNLRTHIFETFCKMSWEGKQMFVISMIDVRGRNRKTKGEISRRLETRLYHLKINNKKERVCLTMFLNTLGIKEWTVRYWLEKQAEQIAYAKRTRN